VPADNLVQAAAQRRNIERPFDAEGIRDVVGRAAGLQLVQEPQALLAERQRQRRGVTGHGADGRGGCAPRLAARRFHGRGQPGDRGLLEQCPHRQFDLECSAQPGDELGGEQRMPAQVEEVVMDADLVDAEKLLPDARQVAFQLALREDDIRR